MQNIKLLRSLLAVHQGKRHGNKVIRNYRNSFSSTSSSANFRCSIRSNHIQNQEKVVLDFNNHHWRKLSSVPVLENEPDSEDSLSHLNLMDQVENRNAEKYFRASPLYKDMMFDPERMIPSTEDGEGKLHSCVQKFRALAMNGDATTAPVTAEGDNSAAIGEVLTHLPTLTDEDLRVVLYYLKNFGLAESAKEEKFMNVWSLLDKECVRRMSRWNIDYLFTVADLWHGLRLSRLSSFHWSVIKKCFRKCDKLTKDQFIRFLFLLNLNRKIPESIGTYDLEYYVGRIVSSLSPMEISVISLAFFKTQTKIKDRNVVAKFLDTVSKNASQIQSIDVAAVAKFARLTSHSGLRNEITMFQEAFLNEIDRLSIPASTHLALVGTTSNSPHKTLISKVVDKVLANLKDARLKELERVSLAMTMFNVECSELAERIVNELRTPQRLEEIRKYGRSLPAILHYLSIVNVLPADLISMALAEGFRNTYYDKKWVHYQRELLCLDFTAELEIPNYSGNRLKPKTRHSLTSMNMLKITTPNKFRVSEYEKVVNRIVKSMENYLGGPDFVYPCNVMPHHHSIEIIYCNDKNGRPVAVPTSYKNIKQADVKRIPVEGEETVFNAVLVCNRSNYLESGELTGSVYLQLRQLRKMGYQVKVVKSADVPQPEETDSFVRNFMLFDNKNNSQ